MSPNVDGVNTKVSSCEIDSVRYANQWKILDNKKSPHPSEDGDFKCKDE